MIFLYCDALWTDNLKTVVMEGSVPPVMKGNVRDDDWRYRNTTLLVPTDSFSAYNEAPSWECFVVKESKEF